MNLRPAPAPGGAEVELDEAELARLVVDDPAAPGALQLTFSAVLLHPGAGEDARWSSGVRLALDGLRVVSGWPEAAGAIGRLRQARLGVDGRRLPRLPLPVQLAGAITLELELPHGLGLVLQADALRLSRDADARCSLDGRC